MRARGWIQLPERRFNPVHEILRRILYALLMLTAVTALVMVDDPVIAVIRGGNALTYKEVSVLADADRLVVVGSKPRVAPAPVADLDDEGPSVEA